MPARAGATFSCSSHAAGDSLLTLLHLSTFYSRMCHPLPGPILRKPFSAAVENQIFLDEHFCLPVEWVGLLLGTSARCESPTRRPVFRDCHVSFETEFKAFSQNPICVYSGELPGGQKAPGYCSSSFLFHLQVLSFPP